ncbi:hypothetical protein [Rhodococcus sp. 05-2254-6]|uniref:hypothetical protein n=1 Tax=Rhodococcus sp. 05-2254-6 TaxID=2022489 RepID=UPI0015C59936|nr:hypothetical protein [Rhodococcus sp. 05-2254-6]
MDQSRSDLHCRSFGNIEILERSSVHLLDAMVAAGAPVRSRVGVPGRARLRAS